MIPTDNLKIELASSKAVQGFIEFMTGEKFPHHQLADSTLLGLLVDLSYMKDARGLKIDIGPNDVLQPWAAEQVEQYEKRRNATNALEKMLVRLEKLNGL